MIECLGLLCLLDSGMFGNLQKIFQALLEDCGELVDSEESIHMKLTLIALKASIDGLIFYGPSEQTSELERIIFQDLLFSRSQNIRQVTIEGVCKMLFSIKLTGNQLQDLKESSQDSALPDGAGGENDAILEMISHLIIQWFDKSHNIQNQ